VITGYGKINGRLTVFSEDFSVFGTLAYVEAAIGAGLDVDAFAPQALLLPRRPQQLPQGDSQVLGR